MRKIFYTPLEQYEGMPHAAMCGDFMPFFWNGEFYLFFLKAESIYLTRTKDFVSFKEAKPAILRSGEEAQDWHIGTGSVIRFQNKFYFYYTGFRKPVTITEEKTEQVIMRAVSDDLEHWVKDKTFFLKADSEHCNNLHWRDPEVFWNEELHKYCMIVTANEKEGADLRKGSTVVYISDSMDDWTFYKIIYAPRTFIAHECHNAFKMGNKWYLIFSNFNNWWETRYRYADKFEGPWIEPEKDDMFDGRQFYAAKSVTDGKRRYLVGWQAVKKDCLDSEKCIWGGTLLVHELVQKENGELSVKPVDSVKEAYTEAALLHPEAVQGKWEIGKVIVGEERQGFGWSVLGALSKECLFEADIRWEKGTRAVGFMLRASDKKLSKYCQLKVECCKGRMIMDRYNKRDGDQSYLEERPLCCENDRMHIQIFMCGDIILSYVNDVALASRFYGEKLGSIGVFVENGKVYISKYSLRKPIWSE